MGLLDKIINRAASAGERALLNQVDRKVQSTVDAATNKIDETINKVGENVANKSQPEDAPATQTTPQASPEAPQPTPQPAPEAPQQPTQPASQTSASTSPAHTVGPDSGRSVAEIQTDVMKNGANLVNEVVDAAINEHDINADATKAQLESLGNERNAALLRDLGFKEGETPTEDDIANALMRKFAEKDPKLQAVQELAKDPALKAAFNAIDATQRKTQ